MQARLVGNAHLIAGNAGAIPRVLALLEAEGIETHGNPDIYIREYKGFGVDDAIELRDRANSRAVSGTRRIFIVATPGITGEAQNALLKTLEEPPADAMFFFIVPAPEVLLPTLRSRTQMLALSPLSQRSDLGDHNHKGRTFVDAETIVDPSAFLAAPAQKRLDMLKPLLEKDDDDKRDLGAILIFLSSLERKLEKQPDGLRALYRARKYIGDKGALVKPLLEQVALLVPKI